MTTLNYKLSTGVSVDIVDRTGETAEILTTTDNRQIYAGRGTHPVRAIDRIDQIVLHHTGFIARDPARFNHVMAHYAVRRNGTILRLRPHTARLQASYHTRRAIDIEFEGGNVESLQFRRYLNHLVNEVDESEWVETFERQMGIDLDDSIVHQFISEHAAGNSRGRRMVGPTEGQLMPTVSQIRAGRLLVHYLVETVETMRFVYAHQQVYRNGHRGNCPGPHLWFNVGKWAVDNLQLRNSGALRRIPTTRGGVIGWEDTRFRLV